MALDLESLSVSEIRKLLALNNVDTRGCVEKSDLVKKAKEHKLHLKQKDPQPSASARPGHGAGPSTGSSAESSRSASARTASANHAGTSDSGRKPTDGTPKERELVQKILKTKDFYAVLGVQRGASDDEIKKGYRKLALQLHPDKNRAAGAEEAFKVASKAFDALSDPQKRAAYDQYGEAATNGTGMGGGNPFAGFGGGGFGGMPGFAGGQQADLDEILRNLFGGAAMGGMGGGFQPFGGAAGFGGAPPRRQQQQHDHGQGGRNAQANGFGGFNMAGISPGLLLPLLPVGLMLVSQLFSLIPFLLKNIHMLVLLFFVPGEWRRPLVMLLLFAMMVGKLGP